MAIDGDKTADYEVLSGGIRVAVLEVKTFHTAPMTEGNGWTRIELQPGVMEWKRERDDTWSCCQPAPRGSQAAQPVALNQQA